MYGFLFEDEIKNYDFWGHCDVDLIFGDIRHFITEEVLSNYDRILSRGHFSLYRNNDECNRFFLRSIDNTVGINSFDVVLNSAKSFAFDEWPGLSRIWKQQKSDRFYDEIIFDDIHQLYGHFCSAQKIKVETRVKNVIFEYKHGVLRRYYELDDGVRSEETLYVHFQKRNMSIDVSNADKYLMVPNRFIKHETITLELLRRYGKRKLIYFHAFTIRWNNLKKKIKLLLE